MDPLTAAPARIDHLAVRSVFVPVYNKQDVLAEFHGPLSAVLDRLALDAEVVCVNDGLTDRSMALLRALQERDRRIVVIALSRNLGNAATMLQDSPEVIEEIPQA